jgi:hypothetical protein
MHAPLLALTAVVLIAWLIVTLSDAPSTLVVLLTVALILRFVIQAALMFAPALSGGWQCASQSF